ncbi:uncharacterized protein VTP21DRAFT_4239 [Calcarisporiella thermophila]|uniref:uncharacterized protein n=1 Tax=Calcarisporiella thermophila TaxID=911321 RepID=UPI00374245DD
MTTVPVSSDSSSLPLEDKSSVSSNISTKISSSTEPQQQITEQNTSTQNKFPSAPATSAGSKKTQPWIPPSLSIKPPPAIRTEGLTLSPTESSPSTLRLPSSAGGVKNPASPVGEKSEVNNTTKQIVRPGQTLSPTAVNNPTRRSGSTTFTNFPNSNGDGGPTMMRSLSGFSLQGGDNTGEGVNMARSRSRDSSNNGGDQDVTYRRDVYASLRGPPNTRLLGTKPHPLQYSWTLYYDSRNTAKPGDYAANLHVIGTFATVESFCGHFNWIKKPSALDNNANYHIFKSNIKPMWEDPANANGGKWVITMRNPTLLDRCWLWLVYALVGEGMEHSVGEEICGAVMSRRARGDRIAVWVRDKDNERAINGLGRELLRVLDLLDEDGITMDFQTNADALRSGTSYNNRTVLSLDALKKEVARERPSQQSHPPMLRRSGTSPDVRIGRSRTPEPRSPNSLGKSMTVEPVLNLEDLRMKFGSIRDGSRSPDPSRSPVTPGENVMSMEGLMLKFGKAGV